MPAIEDRFLAQALLSGTPSTIKDSRESRMKLLDEFLIDPNDSSEQTSSFSDVSADKVIHDDGGGSFRVPKYFQALLTLFACFTLLLATLTIIRQIRKLCRSVCTTTNTRKNSIIRVGSSSSGGENGSQHQQQPENEDDDPSTPNLPSMSKSDRKHFDYYHNANASTAAADSSHAEDGKDGDKKRVRFVRRTSGPFGDEAVDFVGQTYKKKCKEKVQTEHLGQVPGRIRTQQSVRKQNKDKAHAIAHPPQAQPPSSTQH